MKFDNSPMHNVSVLNKCNKFLIKATITPQIGEIKVEAISAGISAKSKRNICVNGDGITGMCQIYIKTAAIEDKMPTTATFFALLCIKLLFSY